MKLQRGRERKRKGGRYSSFPKISLVEGVGSFISPFPLGIGFRRYSERIQAINT
jgi:hypothetical protein